MARRQRRQRVVRRRFVAVVVLVGMLFAGGRAAYGALGGPHLAPSGRPASSAAVAHTTVRPGDSLWSVARRLAPGRDPRVVVDALAAERHGALLTPGEEVTWAR
ncbi:MAG: hypothetical protein ACOYNI_11045 [Acidimicrobiia bacterium]